MKVSDTEAADCLDIAKVFAVTTGWNPAE